MPRRGRRPKHNVGQLRNLDDLGFLQEHYDEIDDYERISAPERRTDSPTRGRLTEEARERLEWKRREGLEPDVRPPGGDRWSSWTGANAHGPEPRPEWVITDDAAVDTDLGILKTGKEADVFLVERASPDDGPRCLLAEKRYRSAEHRLFHRDSEYLEGRRMMASREQRAVESRTDFGRNLIAQQWAVTEFDALARAWNYGITVPYPVQRVGTELMLEFIGDAETGAPAPRLADTQPSPSELTDLWWLLLDELQLMAMMGYTHGDLSPYNILVCDGVTLIDLPQIVDIATNPRGVEYLTRDIRTICGWFRSRGLDWTAADVDVVVADLLTTAFGSDVRDPARG